jgi:ribosomal-protein-alanine N-acetyltransferase
MNVNILPFPVLTTLRLTLRKLTDQDKNEIFALRSDPKVNRFIDRPKPADLNAAAEFIKKINKNIQEKLSLYWGISLKDHAELIGTICLWNFAENQTVAELGYELNPAYQGRGLMLEAVLCILYYGFENISLKRIEAFTHKENLKSIELLKKNGFEQEMNRIDEDHLSNIIFSITAAQFKNR